MIRIVLTDDHAVVREGIKRIFSHSPGIRVVAEANSGGSLLSVLRTTPCDVLVLDISLPDMSGLAALNLVKAEHPKLPVLMLSMHSEAQYGIAALRAGANGYLTKGSDADLLAEAVRRLYAGGKYITPPLAERLAEQIGQDASIPAHDQLSPREKEVFLWAARGLGTMEIAEKLHLSESTVSTYRARVMQKMGLTSVAALVRYAVQEGLID